MRRVIYSRRALRELTALYRFIARDKPLAAVRVLAALYAACDGLVHFPERGRLGPRPRTRELTTLRPYIIEYRFIGEQTIEIVAIWHGAQNRE